MSELAQQGKQVVEELTEWLGVHYRTLIAVGLGIAATGVAAYLLGRNRPDAMSEPDLGPERPADPGLYH